MWNYLSGAIFRFLPLSVIFLTKTSLILLLVNTVLRKEATYEIYDKYGGQNYKFRSQPVEYFPYRRAI